jgi:hypothetical protein
VPVASAGGVLPSAKPSPEALAGGVPTSGVCGRSTYSCGRSAALRAQCLQVGSAGGVPTAAGRVPPRGRRCRVSTATKPRKPSRAECLRVGSAGGVPQPRAAPPAGGAPRSDGSPSLQTLEGGVPTSGVCGRSAYSLRAERLPRAECRGVPPSRAECPKWGLRPECLQLRAACLPGAEGHRVSEPSPEALEGAVTRSGGLRAECPHLRAQCLRGVECRGVPRSAGVKPRSPWGGVPGVGSAGGVPTAACGRSASRGRTAASAGAPPWGRSARSGVCGRSACRSARPRAECRGVLSAKKASKAPGGGVRTRAAGLRAECSRLRAECLSRVECRGGPSPSPRRPPGGGVPTGGVCSAGGVPAAGGVPRCAECQVQASPRGRSACNWGSAGRSACSRGRSAPRARSAAECPPGAEWRGVPSAEQGRFRATRGGLAKCP